MAAFHGEGIYTIIMSSGNELRCSNKHFIKASECLLGHGLHGPRENGMRK